MSVEPNEPYAAVHALPAVSCKPNLGNERLLGISEVCTITGLSPVTASKLMKESGRAIVLHRRVFILESSFFAYLRELEANEPCQA